MAAMEATVEQARARALVPASRLGAGAVTGGDGAKLGTVTELMMEAATGRIGYAAVAVGGVLGVGEKLYAVPWDCFTVDPVSDLLTLNLTAADLAELPGFDKDAWPAHADESLRARCR